MEERIQKVIARAGVVSRRHAELLIKEGRVMVNGRLVNEKVNLVDPKIDNIKINGKPLPEAVPKVYLLLNKPRGYVTTLRDPQGRDKIIDLIKAVKYRVYPVGRLDYDAQGLIILTNDGDLTQKLLHPKNKVEKTYLVKVKGVPSREVIKSLEGGVYLKKDVKTLPARVKLLRRNKNSAWLKVVIFEGKNQQIKRMFEAFGHYVTKINRIGFSTLSLKGLLPGEHRYLTGEEIKKLRGNI